MARSTKSTDELLAAAETAFTGTTTVEKSVEDRQREEASTRVREVLAAALTGLETKNYTGEARDLIAKAAANLQSALRNATAAVKAQKDPSGLAGVITVEDTVESSAESSAE